MRIRSTKPEFWRSRTVASVSWHARLVLKGLESYVDDNGVGKDDVALIVSDVFPRDMLANPRETVARVSEAISDLHQAGLIWRYEDDGRHLLHISNWESIQRIDKPGKGRLRRPDGTLDFNESIIRESVANPRESVAPGTGEQGNRGTGEQTLVPAPRGRATEAEPDGFADFYDTYPRKEKRRTAAKAYASALRRSDAATILAGAQRFAADPNLPDRQYIPHPATWLNGDGWDDDPLPERRPVGRVAPAKPSEAEWWEQQLAAASQSPPEDHRQIENWRTA